MIYPLPPQNPMVTTPFVKGQLHLRWDNPALLSNNSNFTVLGVNVYRSNANSRGPFIRINSNPVGAQVYQDLTNYELITETIDFNTGWNFKGDGPNHREWQIRTQHTIVKTTQRQPYSRPAYANAPQDVIVKVDGLPVTVLNVFGRTGLVTIDVEPTFDVGEETLILAPPITAQSIVTVEFYTPRNYIPSGLEAHVWYRVSTVALDGDNNLVETPLDRCEPFTLMEIERRDYIWDEAVRRNQWILQQGGERVKLFVRKVVGVPCACTRDSRTIEWSKHPESHCRVCFGTGIIGGYEGPYEIIIAPDDAERRIQQTERGRFTDHQQDAWMGPTPVVTQRDFIVKQTNERYIIGPSHRPTNRGNLLQQHFQLSYLDEGDVRYRVPIDGTDTIPLPETRTGYTLHMPRMPVTGEPSYDEQEGWAGPAYPTDTDQVMPQVTQKDNVPDDVQKRGRSRVWENQNY